MRRSIAALCLGLSLGTTGCVRQDTDILAKVGRRLVDKTRESTASLREKLPFKMPSVDGELSLGDRVRVRLANDKHLHTIPFTVTANGAAIDLAGVVENEDQKRRALDLAESTLGVDTVNDLLKQSMPE